MGNEFVLHFSPSEAKITIEPWKVLWIFYFQSKTINSEYILDDMNRNCWKKFLFLQILSFTFLLILDVIYQFPTISPWSDLIDTWHNGDSGAFIEAKNIEGTESYGINLWFTWLMVHIIRERNSRYPVWMKID